MKKKKERIEEQRKRDVESSENVLAKQARAQHGHRLKYYIVATKENLFTLHLFDNNSWAVVSGYLFQFLYVSILIVIPDGNVWIF